MLVATGVDKLQLSPLMTVSERSRTYNVCADVVCYTREMRRKLKESVGIF